MPMPSDWCTDRGEVSSRAAVFQVHTKPLLLRENLTERPLGIPKLGLADGDMQLLTLGIEDGSAMRYEPRTASFAAVTRDVREAKQSNNNTDPHPMFPQEKGVSSAYLEKHDDYANARYHGTDFGEPPSVFK
eukprot:SAG31_NODE_125_length_23649_cov_7.156202_10_plen_132_part_00